MNATGFQHRLRVPPGVRRRGAPHGYFVLEMIIGLIVLAVLASVLGVAVTQNQRALIHLNDRRRATALAEEALDDLRAGRVPHNSASGVRISFASAGTGIAPATRPAAANRGTTAPIAAAAHGAATKPAPLTPTPPKWAWVTVNATVNAQAVQLTGLVPSPMVEGQSAATLPATPLTPATAPAHSGEAQ